MQALKTEKEELRTYIGEVRSVESWAEMPGETAEALASIWSAVYGTVAGDGLDEEYGDRRMWACKLDRLEGICRERLLAGSEGESAGDVRLACALYRIVHTPLRLSSPETAAVSRSLLAGSLAGESCSGGTAAELLDRAGRLFLASDRFPSEEEERQLRQCVTLAGDRLMSELTGPGSSAEPSASSAVTSASSAVTSALPSVSASCQAAAHGHSGSFPCPSGRGEGSGPSAVTPALPVEAARALYLLYELTLWGVGLPDPQSSDTQSLGTKSSGQPLSGSHPSEGPCATDRIVALARKYLETQDLPVDPEYQTQDRQAGPDCPSAARLWLLSIVIDSLCRQADASLPDEYIARPA